MSFFVTKTVDEWGTSYSLTGAGYTALVVLILVLLLAACYLTGEKRQVQTKPMVFAAMAMALGMITSFLKLFEAPMGGSVTLFSMLFICCIGTSVSSATSGMPAPGLSYIYFLTSRNLSSISFSQAGQSDLPV